MQSLCIIILYLVRIGMDSAVITHVANSISIIIPLVHITDQRTVISIIDYTYIYRERGIRE